MRRACLAVAAIAAAWLVAGAATAQLAGDTEQPAEITADSVEYDRQTGIYTAEGDVVIVQEGATLRAEWVAFSNRTRRGVASGDVVVEDGPDRLYADFLQFDVDTLQGVAFDGRVESEETSYVLLGEEMRRTGEKTYEIEEGSFTTCRCPDPEDRLPWKIRARHTDVEVGEKAVSRNTNLDILGVPVLWLPWMRWPIASDRQTGFLMPTLNSSARSGGDIGLPFFWAVVPEVNVIVTPSYIFDRGPKIDLDVEYVHHEHSGGEFHAAFIDDDDIDEDSPSTPFSSQRWAVRWLAEEEDWAEGWRAILDLKMISDNQYPFDFTDMEDWREDRFLESRAAVTTAFGERDEWGFTGSVWHADDLQSPDDLDRDDFVLHRLPDLLLTAPTDRLGFAEDWLRSVDVHYTHFMPWDQPQDVFDDEPVVDDFFLDTGIDALPNGYERNSRGDIVRTDGTIELRSGEVVSASDLVAAAEMMDTMVDPALLDPDGSRDDFPPGPEGNGVFDVGEPLADEGHRLVFNPRLGRPFWVYGDRVELYPEIGLHQTFYQTSEQGFVNRTLLSGRFEARAKLWRSFELPFGLGTASHHMEPSFTYLVLDGTDQDDNPLFVPTDVVPQERVRHLAFANVIGDPSDRMDEFHGFRMALANKIFTPTVTEEGEPGPPRLFADFALASTFDFQGNDLGNFYVDATLYPTEEIDTRFVFGYDYEDTAISETYIEARWKAEVGHEIRLEYRYLREIPRFFESFQFDDERFEDFEEGFTSINQVDFGFRWALFRYWALTYRLRYSIEQSLVLDNTWGVEYVSRCACWAVRVEVEDDRTRGLEFNIRYRVLGLGGGREVRRPFD